MNHHASTVYAIRRRWRTAAYVVTSDRVTNIERSGCTDYFYAELTAYFVAVALRLRVVAHADRSRSCTLAITLAIGDKRHLAIRDLANTRQTIKNTHYTTTLQRFSQQFRDSFATV